MNLIHGVLPDALYNVNILSVSLRLLLALLLGGIIGLERGTNRHPAGFRTHILVCVGATLVMMTNQYMLQMLGTGDPARLGAQVVTGVGFLGAGTILIAGKQRIKGLTTAAGLWASACLGLALGIGFYSGAIVAAILIFISLTLLPKMENYFYRRSKVIDIYIEVESIEDFKKVKKYINEMGSSFYESHLNQASTLTEASLSFNLSFFLPKTISRQEALDTIEGMDGVSLVEEL
jgi:putative Mg2+ transporter-C (MgtC) family protein